jgi:AcrR family transcriptional regulator
MTNTELSQIQVEATGMRPMKRWQRRKHSRPAEILNAAVEELSTKRPDAIRMADIARRAGITKGTIYLYFRNKTELFKCLGLDVPGEVGRPAT